LLVRAMVSHRSTFLVGHRTDITSHECVVSFLTGYRETGGRVFCVRGDLE
jgi:hypothetical protein